MSFETRTVMEQRLELVKLAMQPGANISCLSKRFGISRKVCYKWINRFARAGVNGLEDMSRKPHNSPGRTSDKLEQKVISLRRVNPEWGARKLKAVLQREDVSVTLSASTITTILHRHGLINAARSDQSTPYQRFEYACPNELWQMDFKGQFKMLNHGFCYPLTIMDDHSRFSLCLKACDNQQSLTVKDQMISVFRKYGLPDKILTDNGSPWGTAGNLNKSGESVLSMLEIWLIRLNVRVVHGRPYHPQTQGKEERFHRTLKTELLNYEQFKNIHHCQTRFDKWRTKYNQERPHQAIAYKTPSDLYTQSIRAFPESLSPVEYPSGDIVRKVESTGCIRYKGQRIKVGRGLTSQIVGVRATNIDNVKEVYFCNQKIKDIIVDS